MRKMDYVKAYEDVLRLRMQGLGYKKIRKKILEIHGIKLSLTTISYWVRSIHSSLNGGTRRFPSIEFLKPCEELSYIIGVGFDDGTALRIKHRRGYEHQLEKVKTFIEHCEKCKAKFLRTILFRRIISKTIEEKVILKVYNTDYKLLLYVR